jgi:hypothetical protein
VWFPVVLAGLAGAAWVTPGMYAGAGELSLAAAWTPMTIYVSFWPAVLGAVLAVGAVEWGLRRGWRRAVGTAG